MGRHRPRRPSGAAAGRDRGAGTDAPGDRSRSAARTSTPTASPRPTGITVLGASSDHLVLDVGDHEVEVGDELAFRPGYSGLVRAMTSPFVTLITQRPGEDDVPYPPWPGTTR